LKNYNGPHTHRRATKETCDKHSIARNGFQAELRQTGPTDQPDQSRN